ncbi:zinc-ribbon domain-containing protein [Lentilactobacillus hilgardii]|uniref:zinc-ribbon domain-containing protein n=1 Tax=Lentilactobacillus hilgardii TaxID=1588 RepID=UPI00390CBC75
MSQEKTKVCVMCGKTIPAYANFCPYCGAKQPWLSESELGNSRVKRIVQWNDTPLGRIAMLIGAFLIIIVFATSCRLQDGPGHKTVGRELNQYLFNTQDKTPFGKKPKIKVDKNKGVSIKVSNSGKAVKDLKAGKPTTWNTFVTRVQRRSNSFKHVYSNQLYSKFKVTAGDGKKQTLLKVNQGKVTYNIANKYK